MSESGQEQIFATNIFDGVEFLPGPWVVIIEGQLISQIRRSNGGERSSDGPDSTLMPGLIDCHVHLVMNTKRSCLEDFLQASPGELQQTAIRNLQSCMAAGITTVRDCGSPSWFVDWLSSNSQIGVSLPTVVASGPPVTTARGHCHFFGGGSDSPNARRKLVEDTPSAFTKVMVSGGGLTPGSDPSQLQLTDGQLRALVEVSADSAKSVAAHAHTEEAIAQALDAGASTIEHATGIRPDGIGLSQDLIERLAGASIVIVPTLLPFLIAVERKVAGVQTTVGPQNPIALRNERVSVVANMIQAGVKMAAGTDAGSRLVPFDSVPSEIRALSQAGLTPEESLKAATSTAAEVCGLSDRGRIEAGRRADLIVTEASDPRSLLAALHHPQEVRIGGERVNPRKDEG